MNYLKKLFSYIYSYWYLIVLIIPLLVITLISCKKKEESVLIVSENNTYAIVNDNESNELEIPIYLDSKYKFYIEEKNIQDIYLTDNKEEKYRLKLKQVESTSSTITNKEIELNKYYLICEFNYMSIDKIYIPNAYLRLEYHNNEKYSIQIGSFIAQRITSINRIKVKNLKGIVNNIIPKDNDLIPSTVALLINLETDNYLEIIDIELVNGIGEINKDQIIEFDNLEISNDTDINKLLNNKYRINYQDTILTNNIKLLSKQEKKLLLPISYRELYTINQAGLIITYIYNNEVYKQVIDMIPVFNSNLNNNYYVYNFAPNK